MATTVTVTKSLLARLMGRQGSKRRRVAMAVGSEAKTNKQGITGLIIGAALAFVAGMDAVKKSEWLTKYWWLLPAALIVGGYMLQRKKSPYGAPLMVLGGYMAVQKFYENRDATAAKKATTPAALPVQTQGPGDQTFIPAGYCLMNAGGQQVLLPASQAGAYAQPGTGDPAAALMQSIYGRQAA